MVLMLIRRMRVKLDRNIYNFEGRRKGYVKE